MADPQPGAAIFEPSSPMSAVIPELAPKPGEPVIVKKLPTGSPEPIWRGPSSRPDGGP
jgi:hypothetical protein